MAHKLTVYLHDKYGADIHIGKVDINFMMDMNLEDIFVADSHQDTMIMAKRLRINLNDFYLDKNTFQLGTIEFYNAKIDLHRYPGEQKINIVNFIKLFASKEIDTTKKEIKPVTVTLDKLLFKDSEFSYIDDHRKHNIELVTDFDNIFLKQLNIAMRDVVVYNDSVTADIQNISFIERSGFRLQHLSGKTIVSSHQMNIDQLKILTPNSNLDMDLKFAYERYNAYNHFISQVTIISTIRKSKLNSWDIACFAKEMAGMRNEIEFSSKVKGRVENLKVTDFDMKYGNCTTLLADVTMNGLPKIRETFINLNIRNLLTCNSDLNGIDIPTTDRKLVKIRLPDMISKLGRMSLRGKFTGFYNSFVAYGSLSSDIGSASTDIMLKNTNGVLSYNGKVSTQSLNLAAILPSSSRLKNVSVDVEIAGSGFSSDNADFKVKGLLNHLEFNDYAYTGVAIDGTFAKKIFNGNINVNDPNLKLGFLGTLDFNDTVAKYSFKSDIAYADLKKINVLPNDTVSKLSGKITMDIVGKNIDQMEGKMQLDDIAFLRNSKYVTFDNFKLSTHKTLNNRRNISINSDLLDASLEGFFAFKELPQAFNQLVWNYLPNLNFGIDTSQKVTAVQDFTLDAKIKQANAMLHVFAGELNIAENSTIKGYFNSLTNTASLEFKGNSISFENNALKNVNVALTAENPGLTFKLFSDTLAIGDSITLQSFSIHTFERNDSLFTKTAWLTPGIENTITSGNINFYTYFLENDQSVIGFSPSSVFLNQTDWDLHSGGEVWFDSTEITFKNIGFTHGNQRLSVQGEISNDPLARVNVGFEHFNLSNFDQLTQSSKFDLDGEANGNFYVASLYETPTYYADLKINNFGFNHDALGDAIINTTWDNQKSGLQVNAEIDYLGTQGISKPLVVSGYYYPKGKQNFDLTFDIDNLKLKTLARYLSSFATLKSGTAVGKIRLTGTNKNPEIDGLVKVMRTFMKIDYLNTTYAFSYDSLRITSDKISFNNVMVFDQPTGDTAYLTGTIFHKNFNHLRYDIYVKPKNFQVLNTNASLNELFYGKAYATGEGHIFGSASSINFDILATTNKGTELVIPIGNTTTITDNDYVTFVKKDGIKIQEEEDKGDVGYGINMDMIINVTEDAELQLLMDQRYGDRIKARGNGNIKINLLPDNDFLLYGDYMLTSGDYLFSFRNILNKKFTIDQGSSIKWNGNPYDASMDITAHYDLKASLGPLGYLSSDSNRSVPVSCIIKISNKLSNPEYSFVVDFPSMTDFEKVPYLQAINQNLDNNFISLLLMNRFYGNGSGIMGGSLADAGTKSLSELLSNQINNWLSKAVTDINIGLNYRQGASLTQEEIEVVLSKAFFNDKVIVESNVGVNTGQTVANNKNTNQIIGDVNIEIKITKDLKFKIFNKTNHYDILQYVSPYTQGLGILYRKEFNSLQELFQKKNKKK